MRHLSLKEATLRDHFAVHAMSGEVNSSGLPGLTQGAERKRIARESYAMADAMLAVRDSVVEQCESSPDNLKSVLLVGGPSHGGSVLDSGELYFDYEDGQYHRHSFGIDGKAFTTVYLWSGLHAEEAVDLVLALVRK